MNVQTKHKQKLKGKIVSVLPSGTAVIEVARRTQHPKYKKYFKKTKKYSAHDESGAHKVGDIVVIETHRPISKTKKWIII